MPARPEGGRRSRTLQSAPPRPAVENREIPERRSWFLSMSENEGNMPFKTSGHHARMAWSSPNPKKERHHDCAAANRSAAVSEIDPARPHRAAAGIFARARSKGASDLE